MIFGDVNGGQLRPEPEIHLVVAGHAGGEGDAAHDRTGIQRTLDRSGIIRHNAVERVAAAVAEGILPDLFRIAGKVKMSQGATIQESLAADRVGRNLEASEARQSATVPEGLLSDGAQVKGKTDFDQTGAAQERLLCNDGYPAGGSPVSDVHSRQRLPGRWR